MNRADEIIKLLELKPHPEGGYYREIYRSEEIIPEDGLPERYSGSRSFGTGIYYLLKPGDISAMHKVESDEIFHFYMGDPTELLKLYPDGTGELLEIGTDLSKGMKPCAIIEKGVWQGQRLKEGGEFVLFGTTVCPGFDFTDFVLGNSEELIAEYPGFEKEILQLTK